MTTIHDTLMVMLMLAVFPAAAFGACALVIGAAAIAVAVGRLAVTARRRRRERQAPTYRIRPENRSRKPRA